MAREARFVHWRSLHTSLLFREQFSFEQETRLISGHIRLSIPCDSSLTRCNFGGLPYGIISPVGAASSFFLFHTQLRNEFIGRATPEKQIQIPPLWFQLISADP